MGFALRKIGFNILLLVFICGLTLTSCYTFADSNTSARNPTATSTIIDTLIPPESDSPAAGICADMQGELVTFEVSLDVPIPRCARLTGNQRLQIVNSTPELVVVTFAGQEIHLGPGESNMVETPIGSFLAPGVHYPMVTSGQGFLPSLWLISD